LDGTGTSTTVSVGNGEMATRTITGTLLVCGRYRWLALCPQMTAGGAHATPTGFSTQQDRSLPVAAAGLRLSWALVPSTIPVGIRVFASADRGLLRSTFTIDNEIVWQSPKTFATLGVDVFFAIP
jgi:hypothetical protein